MTHEEIAAAVSDVIHEHVALALSPVLARLAVAESQVAEFKLNTHAIGELRDRVVVVETKSTMPAPVVPEAVDLAPVIERLAASEARLETLGDLRDRVVVMETKSAMPVPVVQFPPVDLEHAGRIAALEKRVQEDMVLNEAHCGAIQRECADVNNRVATVSERLSAVETRTPTRELWDAMTAGAVEIRERLKSLEPVTTDLSSLRERVAVVEVRAQVPGPAGKDGNNGADGLKGKDGVDGLGWDDLAVAQVDDRTVTVKCVRGVQVKELGTLIFPVEIYRGVYLENKTYDRGDCVTWGGSEWHCNEMTTTKPGDGSKAWTLKVKRGRDGKDGRDAIDPMPVVSAGKR